jgi:TolB-like protein
MLSLLIALTVSQGAPVRLAAPGLNGVRVTPDVVGFFSDHLAQQLTLRGLQVITSGEMQSLLGLERQKALLGCETAAQSSCLVELASALGVDGVVMGSVGRFDETIQVNLKVISASDGHSLGSWSGSAEKESAVLGKLTEAAGSLAAQVAVALHRTPPPPDATPVASPSRWWLLPAGVALAGAVTGSVFMARVAGVDSALRGGQPTELAAANSALAQARTEQVVAITAFAVGGGAVIAAGAMLWAGSRSVAIVPTGDAHGGGVSISGALP